MIFYSARRFEKKLVLCTALAALTFGAQHVEASQSLIITSAPIPETLKESVYTRPVEVREITAKEVQGDVFIGRSDSIVTGRVTELEAELGRIQGVTETIARRIEGVQADHDARIADYYANVASINTQLQSGTTPGNPRLVAKLSQAESQVEALNNNLGDLSTLSLEVSEIASQASYLLESSHAAFGLSGAIEEDHIRLAKLEDTTHNTAVLIER
ncbi:MAG: hypothetical protein ACRBCT_07355, partial [Alphaproteobacteria bacterium]